MVSPRASADKSAIASVYQRLFSEGSSQRAQKDKKQKSEEYSLYHV